MRSISRHQPLDRPVRVCRTPTRVLLCELAKRQGPTPINHRHDENPSSRDAARHTPSPHTPSPHTLASARETRIERARRAAGWPISRGARSAGVTASRGNQTPGLASHTVVSVDFAEYVAARRPALVRSAVLLGCTFDDAEDLVQVALAKTLTHWRRVSRAERPDAYVYRILVNAYRLPGPLTGSRSDRRAVPKARSLEPGPPSPSASTTRAAMSASSGSSRTDLTSWFDAYFGLTGGLEVRLGRPVNLVIPASASAGTATIATPIRRRHD